MCRNMRPAFDRVVDEVSDAVTRLLQGLQTTAPAKDRETEARKRRERRLGRTRFSTFTVEAPAL
jgi:hypothetical protein